MVKLLGKEAVVYSLKSSKKWSVVEGSQIRIKRSQLHLYQAKCKVYTFHKTDDEGNFSKETEQVLKVLISKHLPDDTLQCVTFDPSYEMHCKDGDIIDVSTIVIRDYRHKDSGKVITRLTGEIIGNISDSSYKSSYGEETIKEVD